MSAVRMCDRCGKTFSERADGWGTYTGTTTRMMEGVRRTVSETLDLGPCCNGSDAQTPTPQPLTAMPNSTEADRLGDARRTVVE